MIESRTFFPSMLLRMSNRLGETYILLPVILINFLVSGYNVDISSPKFFRGSPASYFGYTVALHKNREGSIALIGAPRANSTIFTDQIVEPGVLTSCRISLSNANPICREVVLDKNGNTYTHIDNNLSYMDKKDKMWLGVSLDVQHSGQNDIVTCGHLWKNQYYTQHYLANGVCYVINSDLDPNSVKKLVPFVHKSKQSLRRLGIYLYAFGQVGTSAAFSEDGNYLLLGAPGYYDWAGTILSYSVGHNTPQEQYVNPIIPEPPHDQNLSPEGYIGYAATSGKFYDTNEIFIAAGAPRDGRNYGRVYIFKALKETQPKISVHQKKEGSQFGEYFGSSLLAVNLNNDLYTDLLVGAPFYSTDHGGDEGRVYVYISNGMGLQLQEALTGSKPNSRFGTAIANIDDINQDGFNDIAIGAPYEDGTGAIYLYHGSKTGIKPDYTQRISAADIKPSLSGFGIHISRGLDIDSNQYPDILVGAYASSEAVLFRTRPIIQASATLSFSPKQINTNITSCVFEGESVPCVNVTACLRYTGRHVPLELEFETNLVMEQGIQYHLISPRGFFLQNKKQTSFIHQKFNLVIGMNKCTRETVYIKPNVKHVITPMQFSYAYKLREPENSASFNKSFPLIDRSSSTNITSSLSFQTGCGSDDECRSDLVVEAEILDLQNRPLIIGKNTSISLEIEVKNEGEPAYLAQLFIFLPTEIISIKQDSCSTPSEQQKQASNATLICDLGDPLLNNKIYRIILDVSKVPTHWEKVDIRLEAHTASIEINSRSSRLTVPIEFRAIADVSITGTSSHEQIPYIPETEQKVPISITHTYFVMNHGPSAVDIVDIILYIPNAFKGVENEVNFLTFTQLEADSGKALTIPAKCNDSALEMKQVTPEVKKTKGDVFGEGDLIAQESENKTTRFKVDSVLKEPTLENGHVSSRSKKSTDSSTSKKRKDVIINCDTAECIAIQCSASPFSDNRKFAKITVAAELNFTLLNEILDPWYRIEFITSGEVSIRGSKKGLQPKHHHPDKTMVKTIIFHPGPPPSEEISQWIIFVSIGVGILLLIIILIALIKIGFFKRQQKEKMKEMKSKSDAKGDDPCLMADEGENSEGEVLNNV